MRRFNLLIVSVSLIVAVAIYVQICHFASTEGEPLEPPKMELVSKHGWDYSYYRDALTGLIYIKGTYYMVPSLNADGTPMTYEQLVMYQEGE